MAISQNMMLTANKDFFNKREVLYYFSQECSEFISEYPKHHNWSCRAFFVVESLSLIVKHFKQYNLCYKINDCPRWKLVIIAQQNLTHSMFVWSTLSENMSIIELISIIDNIVPGRFQTNMYHILYTVKWVIFTEVILSLYLLFVIGMRIQHPANYC